MACLVRAFRWKLGDVQREMKEVEPLARSSLAASVLMKLRGRWAVPAQCEMVLLQGFALKLHDLGFGVVLHKATAAGIRATIFNNAKSNYLFALKAAKKAGRATLAVPFQPTGEPAVAMDWLPRLFQHLFSTHSSDAAWSHQASRHQPPPPSLTNGTYPPPHLTLLFEQILPACSLPTPTTRARTSPT